MVSQPNLSSRCRVDGNMTIKVADFGLSRDLFSRDYYRLEDKKTPLPVRWMAPECFQANVFTIHSDMVSGVGWGGVGWGGVGWGQVGWCRTVGGVG